MRIPRAATLLALLLTLAPTTTPVAATEIDPFYRDLLEGGKRALERGDAGGAARRLRIACFGLLDEPLLLTDGLAHLALAQAASGDDDGFEATFRRLEELEARFQAWTRAPLPTELRATVEGELARRIGDRALAATQTFARLVPESDAGLDDLPPRRRRAALERRIAEEPEVAEWRLELARLEIARRRPRRAVEVLDELLGRQPGNARALCLRARARTALGECVAAGTDLASCVSGPEEAGLAALVLGCLVTHEDWEGAAQLAAGLPGPVRADQQIAELVARIPAGAAPAAPAVEVPEAPPAPPAVEIAEAPPVPQAVEAAEAPPAPGAAADFSQTLAEVRRILDSTLEPAELEGALESALRAARAAPEAAEAWFAAAEAAYLLSRWQESVEHFRRGGEPGDDRPLLLFYYAVALYESGARAEAETVLRRSLPGLRRTPFVDRYAALILGAG